MGTKVRSVMLDQPVHWASAMNSHWRSNFHTADRFAICGSVMSDVMLRA